MQELIISFAVQYHDPNVMNQPDQTRHFPTEHDARVFIHEMLDRMVPDARNVQITKITTKKERIPL